MTRLTIDLATIMEHRYPNGFHAPADIPIDTFLEFEDDDWEHSFDFVAMLEEQRLAAITFGVADVLERRPDLTDEQAWEVARIARELPEQVTTDPAAHSAIAAALDDLETAINAKGEIA